MSQNGVKLVAANQSHGAPNCNSKILISDNTARRLCDIKLVIDAFSLAGVCDRYDTIIYLDVLKM